MRGYTDDEIKDLVTIDQCEWFFWTQHERVTDEAMQANEVARQKAITELREAFNYSDDLIRLGIADLKVITQLMLENSKTNHKDSTTEGQ